MKYQSSDLSVSSIARGPSWPSCSGLHWRPTGWRLNLGRVSQIFRLIAPGDPCPDATTAVERDVNSNRFYLISSTLMYNALLSIMIFKGYLFNCTVHNFALNFVIILGIHSICMLPIHSSSRFTGDLLIIVNHWNPRTTISIWSKELESTNKEASRSNGAGLESKTNVRGLCFVHCFPNNKTLHEGLQKIFPFYLLSFCASGLKRRI